MRAALCLSRLEIRCARHLCRYSQCTEGDTYKQKIRIKSYTDIEKAGLIWVYMGPEDKQPPFYQFEWLDTPDSHRFMQKLIINCNYFQSMEGDFDASHAPFFIAPWITTPAICRLVSVKSPDLRGCDADLRPGGHAIRQYLWRGAKTSGWQSVCRGDALDHAVLYHTRGQSQSPPNELPRAGG